VVPPDELDATVADLVAELATKSSFAMREMKQLTLRRELATAEKDLIGPMVRSFLHGDVAKNARAFFGRRGPQQYTHHEPHTGGSP
jgi:enoyl-CoA hydratase/carnithine racemase